MFNNCIQCTVNYSLDKEKAMKPILLYDIDGTLLQVEKEFLYSGIAEILDQLDIEKPKSDSQSFAGRTDKGIFSELIGDHPQPELLFGQFKALYIDFMDQQLTSADIIRFDDAIESVHIAIEMGFDVGLCTGNFREVALKKASTAGLDNIFEFGGFGCNHADRNYLPAEADAEYKAISQKTPRPSQYIIIGDTPNDIRCARYFGARVAAVCTGSYSEAELLEYQPDWVLKDLSKSGSWLKEL